VTVLEDHDYCPGFPSVLVRKIWKISAVLLLRLSYDATWGINDASLACLVAEHRMLLANLDTCPWLANSRTPDNLRSPIVSDYLVDANLLLWRSLRP
jgi:hypothetical protein